MPVSQTFTASRNATWGPTLVYPFAGPQLPPIDHIAMQLRLYPGAPNNPALSLNPLTFADALASGTAGGPDEMRTLTLSPNVTPAQLQALPGQAEAGDADTFAFDILITYADATTEILSSGSFILSPGVTTA